MSLDCPSLVFPPSMVERANNGAEFELFSYVAPPNDGSDAIPWSNSVIQ